MPLFQSEVQDSRGWRSRWSCRLQGHSVEAQDRSLALRSHYQIPASHWLTPQNSFKESGGNLFQRIWRKIVSKILEENCFKDLGGNQFQRFWRKLVSKNLEVICFKDFGGKLFQQFGRKIVSKILEEICFKDLTKKFQGF